MKRDLKKAVQEYNERYENDINGNGSFYITDINQIKEMSKGSTDANLLFDAIVNALKAGFILGYRKAKRDAAQKANQS